MSHILIIAEGTEVPSPHSETINVGLEINATVENRALQWYN